MLRANEDKMIKIEDIKSFDTTSSKPELFSSGSVSVNTIKIPNTPKAIEEQINIRVAIFCIVLV